MVVNGNDTSAQLRRVSAHKLFSVDDDGYEDVIITLCTFPEWSNINYIAWIIKSATWKQLKFLLYVSLFHQLHWFLAQ